MDDLLHDYFQAEMPKPWPTFKAPKQARAKKSETLWSRYSGRVALAACIALLIAGYWSVTGDTPTARTSNGVETVGPDIAAKDKGPNGVRPKVAPRPQEPDRMEPMGNHSK
jgi:hypothetical protein